MKRPKLLFVTGSRGEWGYIRPIMRYADATSVDYAVCATNMQLLPAYGSLVDEIKRDGFNVSDEIFMSLEGHNHFTMAKSLGIFLQSFVDTLHRQRPDWIILAGDRGEQLMAGVAGAYTYTAVAHIQAGERSGNIDGTARHAIGKLAHVHFAANQDAADRLIKLGEEPFRVHNVGAPQLDELVAGPITDRREIATRFGISVDEDFLLVVQHPVTEEANLAAEQVAVVADAIRAIPMPKVWVLPNNDAGSDTVRREILHRRGTDTLTFDNLTRADYLGLLRGCRAMIGNSSSGLVEAPTFGIPVVNLGSRQADRVRGANVIDAPFEAGACAKALNAALEPDFAARIAGCKNPYGDGRSAQRILNVLMNTPLDSALLVKRLAY
ncbi:MAG: UDP-N-acetylglucosamine 2-epimerase [Gemmatimonadaceae bacterium]